MNQFEYLRPFSLSEAVGLLEKHGAEARPLAGGTDLVVGMRHGQIRPGLVVDVKGILDMTAQIEQRNGVLAISANTVMTDLEEDERVTQHIPALVEAARVVGSVQIRNRATLAGNICNASPAADTPPVLLALGASVVTQSSQGQRTLPLDEFLVGYRKTALHHGELLTAVQIPAPGPAASSAFLKLAPRRAMEISIVCVGARIDLAGDGTIGAAGIGLGSVAPSTVRASRAEELLIGERPEPDVFAAAGEAALEVCDPIDDVRGTAAYRKAMVPVLVSRALAIAADRARET